MILLYVILMILKLPSKIYISSANVDMRKSIDGLVSIVEGKFNFSAMDDAMFVFHNKYCDKIKILYWNNEGFCLLYKRMEKGKFRFPYNIKNPTYSVSEEQLLWLLHGLKIEDVEHYKTIV